MSDKSEKIIHLAREMLRDDVSAPSRRSCVTAAQPSRKISLGLAALITLLGSFCTATLTHMLDESRRPLNKYERVEIAALMFYAAQQGAVPEQQIKEELRAELNINNLRNVRAADYERIRDYLRERIQE